jgi:hypothetical protein
MVHILSSSAAHSQLRFRFAAALLLAAVTGACAGSGPAESQCLPEPAAACTPDINTDFASIHRTLFAPRCGTAGNACHGPSGRQGNLVLADADTAYKALLGQDGTQASVIPGDPGCSVLLQRLESDDPQLRMPFGENNLPEGLRCAVRTWIEQGAVR